MFEPYTNTLGSLPCMHPGTQYSTGNGYTLKKASNFAIPGIHFGAEHLLLELFVGTVWVGD